jgi:hypothetical protein
MALCRENSEGGMLQIAWSLTHFLLQSYNIGFHSQIYANKKRATVRPPLHFSPQRELRKLEALSNRGIHHQCVGITHDEEASVCTEGQVAAKWEEKGCAWCKHKFS